MYTIFFSLLFIFSVQSKEWYEVFGVEKDASKETILKAYQELYTYYNPRYGGDENKFKELEEAKKEIPKEVSKYLNWKYFDNSNIISIGEETEPNFLDIFNGNRLDIHVKLNVTLEDLYNGNNKTVQYKKEKTTQECKKIKNNRNPFEERMRMARSMFESPFFDVHTNNFFRRECKQQTEEIETNTTIDIMKGTDPNTIYKINGIGDEHYKLRNGNVYVYLNMLNHETFTKQGHDLRTTLHISLKESLIGFEKEIIHLDGRKVSLKTDTITQSGETITLENEGMPIPSTNLFGKLFIDIVVDYPEYLTEKQKLDIENDF